MTFEISNLVNGKRCIAILLTIATGLLYIYSNNKRVETGYYLDPFWINVNSISYVLFFGLVSALFLSVVVKKLK
jgi:hypothetical protein